MESVEGSTSLTTTTTLSPAKVANRILSRSPSPSKRSFHTPPRIWSTSTLFADDVTMSRCKSPVSNVRHERGSSADTGLIRIDNFSSNGGSTDDPNTTEDERDGGFRYTRGSSSENMEFMDGPKTRAAMVQVQSKISKTKNQIKDEQTARDDNVNEYLKLASNADKQQLPRIKAVFEKKNQKYAQAISQLQKKLETYRRRMENLEAYGAPSHRQPREVLRDVGQGLRNVGGNIKDGITGLRGSVMSKPKEIASHLFKGKFGSADNINSLTNDSTDEERVHHGSATLPGGCTLSVTMGEEDGGGGGTSGAGSSRKGTGTAVTLNTSNIPVRFVAGAPASDESECSSVTSGSNSAAAGARSHSQTHHSHTKSSSVHSNHVAECATHSAIVSKEGLDSLFAEIRLWREENERLRNKMETMKKLFSKDVESLNQALQDEKFRSERLEEQINDLTELHQNEVENLKQTVCDMEEKVQYQSEERLRDIQEVLESCQTKISKMEHQQAQHQQYLNLEGIENSNARALAVKLINIALTILQVFLLLVATVAGIVMPFLRTRVRVVTTMAIVMVVFFVVKRYPDVLRTGDLLEHFKQFLPIK